MAKNKNKRSEKEPWQELPVNDGSTGDMGPAHARARIVYRHGSAHPERDRDRDPPDAWYIQVRLDSLTYGRQNICLGPFFYLELATMVTDKLKISSWSWKSDESRSRYHVPAMCDE